MIRGYCRVSTIEQASADRASMSQQRDRITGCAMMHGVSADQIAFYEDGGVSGSTPLGQRPDGARLMADLQPGDILVAAKLDRVFRSAEDAVSTIKSLMKAGVKVILCDISADPIEKSGIGMFFFTVMAAAAELDKTRVLERLSDGKRGKKARGGHAGGPAPYGYRIEGRGRSAVQVPVEAELRAIATMRDLASSHSLREISSRLAGMGILDRKGRPFHPQVVKNLLGRA